MNTNPPKFEFEWDCIKLKANTLYLIDEEGRLFEHIATAKDAIVANDDEYGDLSNLLVARWPELIKYLLRLGFKVTARYANVAKLILPVGHGSVQIELWQDIAEIHASPSPNAPCKRLSKTFVNDDEACKIHVAECISFLEKEFKESNNE